MTSRVLSFLMWALVAASLVFWGLRVLSSSAGVPGVAVASGAAAQSPWQHVLGQPPVAAVVPDNSEPTPAGDDRFALLGVIAARGAPYSPHGVALISVDGQPAQAYRSGHGVDGDTVLLAVEKRSAKLGPRGGPATIELALPDPSADTTAAPPGRAPTSRPVNDANGGNRPPGLRPRPGMPAAPLQADMPMNHEPAPEPADMATEDESMDEVMEEEEE